jgi:hypothetical protein
MDAESCYDYGFNNGYGIARENIDLDPEHYTQSEIDAQIDLCLEHESDGFRQFTPFEFFAHDVNESPDANELWEQYDLGVSEGIAEVFKDFVEQNPEGLVQDDD